MTYVRTRLALDGLQSGEILQVRLRGQDPLSQVPASAARQGHRVLRIEHEEGGIAVILIERG